MPSNLRIKVSSRLDHKANCRKHRQFSHDPATMARDLVTLPLPLERDIDIQQQLGNLTSYKLSNCSTNKWKCSNVSTGANVIHVPGVGDFPLPQTWTGNVLLAVADPGFPVGGRRPLMRALFGKNVCKNKRIGSR